MEKQSLGPGSSPFRESMPGERGVPMERHPNPAGSCPFVPFEPAAGFGRMSPTPTWRPPA